MLRRKGVPMKMGILVPKGPLSGPCACLMRVRMTIWVSNGARTAQMKPARRFPSNLYAYAANLLGH